LYTIYDKLAMILAENMLRMVKIAPARRLIGQDEQQAYHNAAML
jgi:hypothetical protein